jgi:hypothetical protein
MPYSVLLVAAMLLLGCAPQQLAVNPNSQAPVCAVKAGQRQSYWNEAVARRDGAMVLLSGECPAPPNSEGGVGGSGGM